MNSQNNTDISYKNELINKGSNKEYNFKSNIMEEKNTCS